jgi:hypothetical protein
MNGRCEMPHQALGTLAACGLRELLRRSYAILVRGVRAVISKSPFTGPLRQQIAVV